MLTRELLLYRVRGGQVVPSFVRREDPELLGLLEGWLALLSRSAGARRGELEEALSSQAAGSSRPKVARGLCKLLFDRLEFCEPAPDAVERRRAALDEAAAVLRAMPDGASLAEYLARLPEGGELYPDLPSERALLSVEAPSARAMLDRYNLALVQGHLLEARRLTLRALAPELLAVRRVLRHLKWCRLVAEVRREGDDWVLEIDGPGAVVELAKKYGLQLASFLPAVPLLSRYRLWAEVSRRGRVHQLSLDESSNLVSTLGAAVGYLPPELASVQRELSQEGCQLDTTPTPRHVGATGLCVPDFALTPGSGAAAVAVELFHPWHQGALARRLSQLAERPDGQLLLCVDRSLAKSWPDLAEHPQVLLYRGFPSAKRLWARATQLAQSSAARAAS